jgi:hypothetical protein
MTACVIYAAKSSEDLRGSLSAQAADCRAAIAAEGAREVVAQYADEAVSGFSRSRGPGLSAALEQVRALAAEHGLASSGCSTAIASRVETAARRATWSRSRCGP